MQLRDYQEEIIKKAVNALGSGRSVIINAPTGTGKTIMALETLRRLDKAGWVYVRTISQYSSWERDAKKLGLTFSGLMRKGEFCRSCLQKRPQQNTGVNPNIPFLRSGYLHSSTLFG